MPDGEDDALREAAAHRGLKLVKSRKRKAGVGDYGRYGLTDGGGKELFGFGPSGLTALPDEIRDYLRKSEVSTWAQSAEVTPDRPKLDSAVAKVAKVDAEPANDALAATADNIDWEKVSPSTVPAKRRKQAAVTKRTTAASPRPRKSEPGPELEPEPKPEPVLEIRSTGKGDLEQISKLVGGDSSAEIIASRFNELKRAGGGVLVADRGGLVGCLAWHVVLGLCEAPIGRITLLLVAENERRQGTGRALLDAARAAMVEQGCTRVEAMSDIEVRNANGFFRALGFEQKSYRFVRDADPSS